MFNKSFVWYYIIICLGLLLPHLVQWFSTFVRLRPGKFFFYKVRPGIIDASTQYWAAAGEEH
jgi:hypothetical protein